MDVVSRFSLVLWMWSSLSIPGTGTISCSGLGPGKRNRNLSDSRHSYQWSSDKYNFKRWIKGHRKKVGAGRRNVFFAADIPDPLLAPALPPRWNSSHLLLSDESGSLQETEGIILKWSDWGEVNKGSNYDSMGRMRASIKEWKSMLDWVWRSSLSSEQWFSKLETCWGPWDSHRSTGSKLFLQ